MSTVESSVFYMVVEISKHGLLQQLLTHILEICEICKDYLLQSQPLIFCYFPEDLSYFSAIYTNIYSILIYAFKQEFDCRLECCTSIVALD